ncbi:hypothetical protein [Streptomyces sp. NPDC050355]
MEANLPDTPDLDQLFAERTATHYSADSTQPMGPITVPPLGMRGEVYAN